MDLAIQVLTSLELQQDRFVYPVSLRGISVNLTVWDHVSELRLPVVLSSHGHEMPNPSETWTFRLWRHKISTSKKICHKIYRKGDLYTFWGPTQLLLLAIAWHACHYASSFIWPACQTDMSSEFLSNINFHCLNCFIQSKPFGRDLLPAVKFSMQHMWLTVYRYLFEMGKERIVL